MHLASPLRPTPRVLSCALLVAGCALVPAATVELGIDIGPPAALLLLAAFCQGLTAVLLAQRYVRSGDRRLLALTATFVVSAVLVGAYVLAAAGGLGDEPARSAWLWIAWHAALPLGIAASVAPRPAADGARPAPADRDAQALRAVAAALPAALALAGLALGLAAVVPGLAGADRDAGLAVTGGAWVVLLAIAALPVVDRRAFGPLERWLLLVVTASLLDAVLGVVGGSLTTVGGAASVLVVVVASATLPAALLAEIGHLHRDLADARAQLRHDAEHDDLTGVLTRRSALARARRMAREEQLVASVAVLDLDHFKAINDGHGHATGDRALAATGRTIRHALRDSDVIGRLGGEEFLIVLPGCDRQRAAAIIGRLLTALRETRVPEAPGLRMTASVGIAELGDDEERLTAALARADAALYRAKAAGRDRIRVADPEAPTRHPRSLSAAAIERPLR
ncbi:GGDEF domain-containing protein [Patulibacter defluvii]|uniref:GGDEF domain-containing protein n=1 Tax=Patulibacter defluvii TaxID=3095358 RepID=UPI002A74B734|nr:GGDEF domain-containing protein [Patulibacter sp. DM4]